MSEKFIQPEDMDDDFSDFMSSAADSQYYTPDGAKLQKYLYQDIFVYDKMKKGFGQERLLGKEPISIGVGFTVQQNFHLLRRLNKSGTSDAVVLSTQIPTVGASIYGEIYRVKTSHLYDIDFEYSNQTNFKRAFIPIKIRRGNGFIIHTCWAYIGIRKYWNDKIGKDLFGLDRVTSALYDRHYYNFEKKYILNS